MSRAAGVPRQLRQSPLVVVGRFADASNLTLLARTADSVQCVYKPIAGERPLWDFPTGTLAHRESATWLFAQALRWDVVPETALRTDGPFGPGVCQIFVERGGPAPVDWVRPDEVGDGWLVAALAQDDAGEPVALVHRDVPGLRQLALLDALANNADRKGGHILADASGRLWGIDHGLTFHPQDKLRTVLWGFAGQPIGDSELAALTELAQGWEAMTQPMAELLTTAELRAARERVDGLVAAGRFPQPAAGWPRLPWPVM